VVQNEFESLKISIFNYNEFLGLFELKKAIFSKKICVSPKGVLLTRDKIILYFGHNSLFDAFTLVIH
jgi:hypothetical protein